MINQKELNRVYRGKDCVGFDYFIKLGENETLKATFKKSPIDSKQWALQVVMGRTRDADSQVYWFDYVLPKEGMDLTMIASIGLKYFQLYLKEEVQMKTNLDFALGEITGGMVG